MAFSFSKDISFFIPCLNEEKNILNTLKDLTESVSNFKISYEIIIVDDNSTDNTLKIVNKYIHDNKDLNINIVKNNYSKGLGRNFVDQAFRANGENYMLINGDNAEPKETITKILSQLNKSDIIIPYFGNLDNRKLRRKLISMLFTKLVNIISGLNIPYYNGPAIHKTYNVVRWSPDSIGFAYQAELIVNSIYQKNEFTTVKITNMDRKLGVSSAFKLINVLSVLHSLTQILLKRIRKILFKV